MENIYQVVSIDSLQSTANQDGSVSQQVKINVGITVGVKVLTQSLFTALTIPAQTFTKGLEVIKQSIEEQAQKYTDDWYAGNIKKANPFQKK